MELCSSYQTTTKQIQATLSAGILQKYIFIIANDKLFSVFKKCLTNKSIQDLSNISFETKHQKNHLPNQENMLGKSHDKKIEKTLFLRVLKNYQRKTSYLQSFH